MTRTTVSVLAALMFGGASVALAAGADKSSADQTKSPARAEQQSSGSGTTSGMSAGESSKSGSSTMTSPSTGSTAGTSGAAAGSASQMTEAEAEAKLEKEGYTQVSGLKKVGDKYEANAMKNGKSVEVEIDPATGMVKDKSS